MYKVNEIKKIDKSMNKDKVNYYRRIGVFPEPDSIKNSKGAPQPHWTLESIMIGIKSVKKFKEKPRNTLKNKNVIEAYKSRLLCNFDRAMKLMIVR